MESYGWVYENWKYFGKKNKEKGHISFFFFAVFAWQN